ncbi:MAG: DNA-3-methyladenine glycosylase I, partial [Allosphingosinicella sp.]
FVGSTICYAFMQAVGMVNDHERRCFRHSEISSEGGGDNLPTDAHGGRRG